MAYFAFVALVAILVPVAASASSGTESWPEYWQQRTTDPERSTLGAAFNAIRVGDKTMKSADTALYGSALEIVTRLLAAEPGVPDSNQDRLRVGRGWLFRSALECGLRQATPCSTSVGRGADLIEGVGLATDGELALAIDGAAKALEADSQYLIAVPLRERVLTILERLLGPAHPYTSTALMRLSLTYIALSRYADALPLQQRALVIDERTRGLESPSTVLALVNLASTYSALARHADALQLNQRVLDIREKTLGPEHQDTVLALISLASTYSALERHADALPLLQRALTILEAGLGPEHPATAGVLSMLASGYGLLFRYSDSLLVRQRALAIYEKVYGPEHPNTARELGYLGLTYVALARHSEAFLLQRRALAITERVQGPEHPDTAQALSRLGSTYGELAQYAEELPLQQRALAIYEKVRGPLHPDTALALMDVGTTYDMLGQTADGLALQQRALAIYENVRGLEDADTARCLTRMAQTYRRASRLADALDVATRALSALEVTQGPNTHLAAWARVTLASILLGLDRAHDALPIASLAASVASALDERELLAATQDLMRRVHSKLNAQELAILWGKESINTLQSVRAGLTGLDLTRYLDSRQVAYQGLADLLIAEGRLGEAAQVLQMLKTHEIAEIVQRSGGGSSPTQQLALTGLEQRMSERYSELRDRQIALAQERGELRKKDRQGVLSAVDRMRLDEIQNRLIPDISTAVSAFLAGLQKEVDAQRARSRGRSGEAPLEEERVAVAQQQSQLAKVVIDARELEPDARAVAIQYVVADDRLSIILTVPEVQPIVRQIAVSRKEIGERITQVKLALMDRQSLPAAYLPALQQLHSWLIAPVLSDLQKAGAKTLILSLNDVLRYLPFAALHDGKRHLVQDFALAHFTAAAAGPGLLSEPPRRWNVAGMGLTLAVDELPALHAVPQELQGILAVKGFNGSRYLDSAFTRRQLQATLEEPYNVLHVASHFKFEFGRAEASRLYLGDKTALTLANIVAQDWRFDKIHLITLSACETGIGGGRDAFGQEIEGLGALVQQRGAKAAMVTLWKIDDDETPWLMRGFYGGLSAGLTKAQALRAIQLAYIEPGGRVDGVEVRKRARHPYYWAPFVLMGNWR